METVECQPKQSIIHYYLLLKNGAVFVCRREDTMYVQYCTGSKGQHAKALPHMYIPFTVHHDHHYHQ